MKSLILSVVLILVFTTACNETFDVGIEHQSTSTALAAQTSNTQAPASTPVSTLPLPPATDTFVPVTNLAPSATFVPNPPLALSATPLPNPPLAPTASLVPSQTSAPAATNTAIPVP